MTDTAANIHAADPAPPQLALVRSSPFSQLRELAQYLADLDAIAKVMCQATILPREMQAPANLKLVLMQGLEMGFTPIQAIRASFIITSKNEAPKVGYYVSGLVALVHRSSVCRFFRVEETTSERCRVVCARADEDEQVLHTFDLTMEQAKKSRFDVKPERDQNGNVQWKQKYPWMTAPADMLLWRCAGRAVKAVFPDVVFGLATPDELDDLETAHALERTGPDTFVATPTAPPRAPAPTAAPTRRTEPEVVDAELVEDPPAQDTPSTATNDAADDDSSGDPAWDEVLGVLGTLANVDTRGWIPRDLMAAWNAKIDAVRTRAQLNALGPWISEMSARAAKSKACGECAAAMKVSFNAATAVIRKSEQKA